MSYTLGVGVLWLLALAGCLVCVYSRVVHRDIAAGSYLIPAMTYLIYASLLLWVKPWLTCDCTVTMPEVQTIAILGNTGVAMSLVLMINWRVAYIVRQHHKRRAREADMASPEVIVLSVLGVLGTIATGYFASRQRIAEIERQEEADGPKDEASIANQYRELAAKQAGDNTALREDLDKLRSEVVKLRSEQDECGRTVRRQAHIIDDFIDWTQRLVAQLASHGDIQPVPFRSSYEDISLETLNADRKKRNQ